MKKKKPKERPSEPSVLKSGNSTPATLSEKKALISGLVSVINLLPRTLSFKQKEMVDALEYGLIDRTMKLRQEYELKEADLKIEQMQKLIALIKNDKTF